MNLLMGVFVVYIVSGDLNPRLYAAALVTTTTQQVKTKRVV